MESGIPLTTIADAMQTGGVMEGKHSLDVGILILPVLIETMAYLAEEAGIKYNAGSNVETSSDIVSDSTMAVVKQKVKEKMGEPVEEKPVMKEPEMEEKIPPQGGLMSRGAANGV